MERQARGKRTNFDSELGWTRPPNVGKRGRRTNSQGMRGEREYAPSAAAGVVRIAAFGASFTYGEGVADHEVWTELLRGHDPRLEVLNFGVGGYGPGQALLRYRREGRRFHPDVVLIGFMRDNIRRAVNVFRPFYLPETGIPLAKPRFALEGEELGLLPNPMPSPADYARLLADEEGVLAQLGANDHFFRTRYRAGPWDLLGAVRFAKVARSLIAASLSSDTIYRGALLNPHSEALAVTVSILETFQREVRGDGARSFVLVFPSARDVRRRRGGRPSGYEPLLAELRRRDVRHLDVMQAFVAREEEPSAIFRSDGHPSVLGNERIAALVAGAFAEEAL